MTIQIQAGGLTDFCAGIFEHVGCLEVGNQSGEPHHALGGESDHVAKATGMNAWREALAAAAYP